MSDLRWFQHIQSGKHHLLEAEPETADDKVSIDSSARVGTAAMDTAVQLVTLDVRSLRPSQQTWRTATPTSSVDLEWENDGELIVLTYAIGVLTNGSSKILVILSQSVAPVLRSTDLQVSSF